MINLSKLTLWILLAFFFSQGFSAPLATASADLTQNEWKVPFFGDLSVPLGFSAVEVKDFKKFMEQEKASSARKVKPTPGKPPAAGTTTMTDFLPADMPVDKDKAMDRLQKADFALYHLTMDDGDAFHIAWFLAAIDGEVMPPDIDVFSKELTPEQAKQLDEFKIWVDANKAKAQFNDPSGKMSVKLLDMMPVEVLQQADKKMWTIGARAMFTVEEMPFAFFARIYAFPVNGRMAGGVLFGLDGDRPFWDPVIRQVLQNMTATR